MKMLLFAICIIVQFSLCALIGIYAGKTAIFGFELMNNQSDFDLVLGVVLCMTVLVVTIYLLYITNKLFSGIYKKLKID